MAFAHVFQPNVFQQSVFQQPTVDIDPGSRISGGTFSRKKWRDLIEEKEAQERALREEQDRETRRALEIKRAADAKARAALRARWAQEDALAAAAAYERQIQAALEAKTGMQNIAQTSQEAVLMRQAMLKRQDQDEEEEAIALLLLS